MEAEVDGELILLSPSDFSYFGAAGTGAPVWELVDGQRSVGGIVAELEAKYEAPEGVIRAETLEFIEVLTTWSDEMLRMPPDRLMKAMGVGAKISRAVRRKT